jgi:hypothetical protein
MGSLRSSRPSPATVVALLALVVAVAGTAVAANPVASKSSLSAGAVKRIANAQIKKRLPAYALVKANGDVVASRSLRVTNA